MLDSTLTQLMGTERDPSLLRALVSAWSATTSDIEGKIFRVGNAKSNGKPAYISVAFREANSLYSPAQGLERIRFGYKFELGVVDDELEEKQRFTIRDPLKTAWVMSGDNLPVDVMYQELAAFIDYTMKHINLDIPTKDE